MKRRRLLRRTVALAAAGLAGCVSDPGGPGDDSPTSPSPTPTATPPPTQTPTPSSTPTSTPTPASTPSDATFQVNSVGPGTGENTATVTFADGVEVDGVIAGNNGCYTAVLESARLSDGVLTVLVRAKEEAGQDMCTQSLVDIDYSASFAFEGSLPRRAVVKHDSLGEVRTVAEAER